jgi:pimeloyl-ACP methyl ester carboxylesterase
LVRPASDITAATPAPSMPSCLKRRPAACAARHRVVTFDNRGVGASSGSTPTTIEEMASDAVTFIRALGFDQAGVFGFSMSGMIARVIAQEEPRLVRKMIIAGTGPAGGDGIEKVTRISYLESARGLLTRREREEFLFFTRTPNGRGAAKEPLARLEERTDAGSPIVHRF